MSDTPHPVQILFTDLANRFQTEDRVGATSAATALQTAAQSLPTTLPTYPNPYEIPLSTTLASSTDPVAKTILSAMPYIRWGGSDLREGRIPDALANQMPMCELLGPDGLFPVPNIRVGLWMQQPNLTYGPRRHAAEETFLIFAGSALWSTGTTPPTRHSTGATVHHPSNILHTSITTDRPVLAAWRWSGDIGFDKYALKS